MPSGQALGGLRRGNSQAIKHYSPRRLRLRRMPAISLETNPVLLLTTLWRNNEGEQGIICTHTGLSRTVLTNHVGSWERFYRFSLRPVRVGEAFGV